MSHAGTGMTSSVNGQRNVSLVEYCILTQEESYRMLLSPMPATEQVQERKTEKPPRLMCKRQILVSDCDVHLINWSVLSVKPREFQKL